MSSSTATCFRVTWDMFNENRRQRFAEMSWNQTISEPPHVKTTKWHVRPAKTQISLGIRPVWSEPSLCALWVSKDPSFLHADTAVKTLIRLGRCPGWSESSLGAHVILVVLSCGGSSDSHQNYGLSAVSCINKTERKVWRNTGSTG